MPDLENSELVTFALQTLLRIISKRTSDSIAFSTLQTTLNKLSEKYDFLHTITLKNEIYAENQEIIHVSSEINQIRKQDIITFVKEIIDISTGAIGEKADYFFIREVRDNLGYAGEPVVNDFLVDLNYKQFAYILDRKKEIEEEKSFLTIKNSEIIEPILTATFSLFHHDSSQPHKTVSLINKQLDNYKKHYNFFHFISLQYSSDDNTITVYVSQVVDTIPSETIAKAFEQFLEKIGFIYEGQQEESFINKFKQNIGEKNYIQIQRFGINIRKIDLALRYQNRRIVQKVLHAILEVLQKKTSTKHAHIIIGETIVFLQGIIDILQYITIKEPDDTHTSPFVIDSKINSIEPYKIGMSLREVIKMIQKNFKDKHFIEDFKTQLGNDYLEEIEKIGVNLHFLELQYR